MSGKKVAIIASVIIIVIALVRIVIEPLLSPTAQFSDSQSDFYDVGFSELSGFISDNLKQAVSNGGVNYWTQIGITSHHLPIALSLIADFYKKIASSEGPREVFVILGPDHFEKCHAPISTTRKSYINAFGQIYSDGEIINQLFAAGVQERDDCFSNEHSIGVQTIFIKYLFPEAKIVPLLFSATTEDAAINNVVEVLSKYKDKITVIVSTDFSHYRNYDQAKQLDEFSKKMIRDLNSAAFNLEYIDSPAAIKTGILLAKKFASNKAIILKEANSFDFNQQSENTTGYINAIFVDYQKTIGITQLFFVGDIMLSRFVGDKIKTENNWSWPFLKIADYLKQADLTVGNLESPISNRGIKVGSIYSFRADPGVVAGLNLAGFDILSVANNHIGDYTRTAMEDTLNILKANNINYIGGGFNENEAHSAVVKEIKGLKIAFLAYTALGAKYTEAQSENSGIAWLNQEGMVGDIKAAKENSDFVVVFVHFGEEYQKKANAFQKNIAHIAIDSGASLVIGHHPHVVQEIEQYKNGYIAYSLGNFVFDQLFSQETMAGLILKVVLDSNKNIEIEQVKTKINQDFQVELAE